MAYFHHALSRVFQARPFFQYVNTFQIPLDAFRALPDLLASYLRSSFYPSMVRNLAELKYRTCVRFSGLTRPIDRLD